MYYACHFDRQRALSKTLQLVRLCDYMTLLCLTVYIMDKMLICPLECNMHYENASAQCQALCLDANQTEQSMADAQEEVQQLRARVLEEGARCQSLLQRSEVSCLSSRN
jgi:hypothetical protein